MIPGEIVAATGSVTLNDQREQITVEVSNVGDRPIQVGSHFHFADVNTALHFDRGAAAGMRMDLPAGSSARFEPGMSKAVALVALGGERRVPGLQRRP